MAIKSGNFHLRRARLITRVIIGSFAISLAVLLLLALINAKNWRPVPHSPAWTVSTNFSPTIADWIIDRNLETRWTSGVPMSSGMYVQLDLPTPQRLNGLVLHIGNERRGQPKEWLLKISPDGVRWHTLTPLRDVTSRSMLAIFFRPVTVQSIQIIQTSVSATLAPWVIHELIPLQPVVPWDLSPLTVIVGFLIWGIALLTVLFTRNARIQRRLYPQQQPHRALVLLCILLLFLPGILLRVSAIDRENLAPDAINRLSILDLRELDHQVWLKEYRAIMPEMPGWLGLLITRLGYQIVPDIRSALMIFPTVSSLILAGLIVMQAAAIPQRERLKQESACPQQQRTWEALTAASVINLAGLFIWLDRQGHVATLGLVFLIAYTLLSEHWLSRQGKIFWLPALAALSLIGFAFEPLIGLFPWVVAFTAGIAAGLPTSAEGPRKRRFARWGLLLLSVLPLALIWRLSPWKLPDFALQTRIFPHLREALSYSGLLDGWAWIWWGLTLIGGWQLWQTRSPRELRFYLNLSLFALLANGFSDSHWLPEAALMLGVLLLVAKGVATACTWGAARLDDLKLPVRHDFLAVTGLLLTAAYCGGFAYNSLFTGLAGLPHAPDLTRRLAQARMVRRQLTPLHAQALTCDWVGLLDPELSDYLAQTYGIAPQPVRFTDIRRQAKYGRFASYLITSATSEYATHPDAVAFFTRYYAEYARSDTLTVYQLRAPFANLPQRYLADDLLGEVGKRRQDKRASKGNALVATSNDPAGALVSWPVFRLCGDGAYTARFRLRVEDGQTDGEIVMLEAIADAYTPLTRRALTLQDFGLEKGYQEFELTFTLPTENPAYQLTRLQLRVQVTGLADVYLSEIELIPPNSFDKFGYRD